MIDLVGKIKVSLTIILHTGHQSQLINNNIIGGNS